MEFRPRGKQVPGEARRAPLSVDVDERKAADAPDVLVAPGDGRRALRLGEAAPALVELAAVFPGGGAVVPRARTGLGAADQPDVFVAPGGGGRGRLGEAAPALFELQAVFREDEAAAHLARAGRAAADEREVLVAPGGGGRGLRLGEAAPAVVELAAVFPEDEAAVQRARTGLAAADQPDVLVAPGDGRRLVLGGGAPTPVKPATANRAALAAADTPTVVGYPTVAGGPRFSYLDKD